MQLHSQAATPGGATAPVLPAPAGFSLLVLLAAMAVLAILALALVPTGIRELRFQAQQREREALKTIASGLRNHILDTRSVPASGTVFTNVAAKIGWPVDLVRTNRLRNPRLFLVDPAFQMGTNTATTLPFVQGVYGITNVGSLRVLFVSSVGAALPAVISNAGTNAAAVFQMLWNARDHTVPTGWTWGGSWEDISVERLSLVPLLAQVVLQNSSPQMGHFSIDNTNAHVALPTNTFTSLYLVRSLLGLHSHTGDLQAMQVMQDVTSLTNGPPYFLCPTFVYESGQWRGRYYKGTQAQKHNGEDLQAAYDLFMSGPANVYQVGGVTQATLTQSLYVFMSNYVNWANSGFNSSLKAAVQSAQSALASQVGTYCNQGARVN